MLRIRQIVQVSSPAAAGAAVAGVITATASAGAVAAAAGAVAAAAGAVTAALNVARGPQTVLAAVRAYLTIAAAPTAAVGSAVASAAVCSAACAVACAVGIGGLIHYAESLVPMAKEVPVGTYKATLQLLLNVLLTDEELSTAKFNKESELETEIYCRSTPERLKQLQEQALRSSDPGSHQDGALNIRVPKQYLRGGAGNSQVTFTKETLLQFVDRAAFVHDICRADGRLHQFLKVALVVGEENVGKSSLVKCILGRCGRGQLADSVTVGHKEHTRDMEVYSCQVPLSGCGSGNLLLVDSPGTSSPNVRNQDKLAWQCLERVPDLCFVVVRFNGDVQEKDHEISGEIAQRRVCASENQVLLVNHVDAVLHGKPKAPIWEELNPLKMQDMREDFALSSDVQRDRVLMTVLDNENLFEQEMDLLRERGVLTQEEATDTVMSILQNLFTD